LRELRCSAWASRNGGRIVEPTRLADARRTGFRESAGRPTGSKRKGDHFSHPGHSGACVVLRSVDRHSSRDRWLDGARLNKHGPIIASRSLDGAGRHLGRHRDLDPVHHFVFWLDIPVDGGRGWSLLCKLKDRMPESNQNSTVCPNGHVQPSAGSRFCIYCGTPLAVSPPPPAAVTPPNAAAAAPPMQPVPPVANGQAQFQAPPQQPVPPIQVQQQQQFAPPAPPQQAFPQANQNYQQFPNPQPKYFDQQPQYQPAPQQYTQFQPPQAVLCNTCGGYGQGLAEKAVVCSECGWLRPLVPGYQLENSAFAWAADAKAMAVLQGMKPLAAAAKLVSEKVGRRWVEASFNAILLSEKQVPQIYGQAVRAARILGMSHMPDVYLSGDRAWDCLTFGTNRDSFIVIGSALAGNFQGVDMLFLLAREMGHCRAGHAVWKTVIRFFLGEQGPAKGFMAGGIFKAILNPTQLVTGAIEMPLLAWARQSEITADRAGLLAVGSEEVARRVLLSWSLRSSVMFRQLNIDDWLEQQSEEDDHYTKLSEITTSSTPYLGPRMKRMAEFARSPELKQHLGRIAEMIKQNAPKQPPPAPKKKHKTPDPNILRFKCSTCETPMRVPKQVLEGKQELPVKCPNAKCGAIMRLKKNIKAVNEREIAAKRQLMEEDQTYAE
jgi:Zn-dependent protease with chaperone function